MLAQSDLRDLGIHTEMLCDCYLDMYRAGRSPTSARTSTAIRACSAFAIGSEDLYDWVRENPGVVTYPISYCNAPSTVRNIENFVSINNCISVDLYGQISPRAPVPARSAAPAVSWTFWRGRRCPRRQGLHLSDIHLHR